MRYGGEEFILILTAVNSEACLPFLNKLMLTIEKELELTVSLGIASSTMFNSFDQLLNLADKALYSAKQNGRNQLSIAKIG